MMTKNLEELHFKLQNSTSLQIHYKLGKKWIIKFSNSIISDLEEAFLPKKNVQIWGKGI